MQYQIRDNNITFGNGYSLDLEYPIKETLLIDDADIIVVILDAPWDKPYTKNVFAFTTTGDYLWQIGEVELFNQGPNCRYVGADINGDDELVLYNWCDTAVVIDANTGNILRTYITK